MATMARIHGKNGIVYLQGSGAAAVLLTQAGEWSVDRDFDSADVPILGDFWNSKVKGLMKHSEKVTGPYDNSSTLAWDAAEAQTSRSFYIYPDRTNMLSYYYGFCWPKLSVKGGTGSAVTFDLSAEGDGQVGRN